MRIINERKFLIDEIDKKVKPLYHKDAMELNEILYKNKYFEQTGRGWSGWLKNLPLNRLKMLWNDLKNSNL